MYKQITLYNTSLLTYSAAFPGLPLCFSNTKESPNPELPCISLEFSIALKALPRTYTKDTAQSFRTFFTEPVEILQSTVAE